MKNSLLKHFQNDAHIPSILNSIENSTLHNHLPNKILRKI